MTAVVADCRLHRTRMQHRPISRASARRSRAASAAWHRPRSVPRFTIAGRRPQQRPALRDQKTLRPRLHHRAIRQLLQRHRQSDAAASCHASSRSRCSTASISGASSPLRHCPPPTPRENGWRRRGGSRSTADVRPRTRWPRRERTIRSSFGRPSPRGARPRNSQTQVSHAGCDQRFLSSVLVAGSWMMPRLPVNSPRCGVGDDVAGRRDAVLQRHGAKFNRVREQR